MSLLFLCLVVTLLHLCRTTELGQLNGNPTSSFTFVRRFAKSSEVTNTNSSSSSADIVEMTQFIDKAADPLPSSSFTIITKVRPFVDSVAQQQQQQQQATARRADAILPSRTPIKLSHVKSSSAGTFSLRNGMIVFAGSNDTDGKAQPTIKHATPTMTTPRAAESSAQNSAFSASPGKKNPTPLKEALKPPSLDEKLSFTFLPTPAWSIGNKTVSKLDFDSEIENSIRSKDAARRLPTVRLDKDTVFVPAASFRNGTILYNRLSIEDFLRDHQENVTLYDFPEDAQTTPATPNIPLSHMEILYPGFRDVVKQKPSQIIIQNIFVTPNKEPVIETNTLSQDQVDRFPNGFSDLQNATNVFVMGYQTTTSFSNLNAEGEQAESTQQPVTTSSSPTASTPESDRSPTTVPTASADENDDSTISVSLATGTNPAPTVAPIPQTSSLLTPDASRLDTTSSESTTITLQTLPPLDDQFASFETSTAYFDKDLLTSTTTSSVPATSSDTEGPESVTVASSEKVFSLNHSLYYSKSSTTEGSAMTIPLEIDPLYFNTVVDQLLSDGTQAMVTRPTVSKTTIVADIPELSMEPQETSVDNEILRYNVSTLPPSDTATSSVSAVNDTTALYASEPTTIRTTERPDMNTTFPATETTAATTQSAEVEENSHSTSPASPTSTEISSSTATLAGLANTRMPSKHPMTNSGLAAMILAHTAALMAGKPSPLVGKYSVVNYKLNSTSNSPNAGNATRAKPDSVLETVPSLPDGRLNFTGETRSNLASGSKLGQNSSANFLLSTTETTTTTSTERPTTTTNPTKYPTTSTPPAETSTSVEISPTVDVGIYMEPDLDYSSVFFNGTESDLNVTDFSDYSDDYRVDVGIASETPEEATTLPESSVEENQRVAQHSGIPLSTAENPSAEDSIKSSSTEAATTVETVSEELDPEASTTTGKSPTGSTALLAEMEENETTTASRPVTTMETSTVRSPGLHAELVDHFSCGDSSSGIDVNFVNPNFPGPDVSKGRCTFQLIVPSRHVCQLRVDFNDTRMLLPRQGFCLDQYLSVTGAILIPGVETFCGRNPDQHFYLELTESLNLAPRIVEFHVATAAEGYLYRYGLRIRQIDCNLRSEIRAPRGCFQYYTQNSGLIKSFNFEGGQYYNNANYRICVRTMSRGCAIALVAPEGGFGIHKINSRKVPMNRSGVGSRVCRRDYLWIPSGVKEEQSLSLAQDRYCGAKLSNLHGDNRTRPVIARLANGIYSMQFRSGTPRRFNALSHGPGFRLSYTQLTYCPPSELSAILQRASTSKTAASFGPVNSTLLTEVSGEDPLRFAAPEEISEDYYDDDSEAYKPTPNPVANVTFTEHLNQLIKASLWISKVARNVTHGINW